MIRSSHFRRFASLVLVSTLAGALLPGAGCGDTNPPRVELHGRVTFRGEPVPKGYIIFRPQGAAGDNRPGTHADIESGEYRMAAGKGLVAGQYVAEIHGFDGQAYQAGKQTVDQGMPLFPRHENPIRVDAASGSHDFDIPDTKS